MTPSAFIINLVITSSFGGILIGSTILIKNKQNRSNWPIAVLLISVSAFLSGSLFTWSTFQEQLIVITAIGVPLFANVYLNSLFRGHLGISVKHLSFNLILLTLLSTVIFLDVLNLWVPLIIAILIGLAGIVVLQKRLAEKLKGNTTRRTWLQAVLLLLILLYASFTIALINSDLAVTILMASLSIFVLGLVTTLVLMPRYLYQEVLSQVVVPKVPLRSKKSSSFTLSQETKNEYISRIQGYMEERKPYLNERFTLNKLAQHLELSPTYTSRVINEMYGKNFRDFVNTYRIRKACECLKEEKMKKVTIEAIAAEAGFHSRTAFYNAFKKIMKVSPGEYMANCGDKKADEITIPHVLELRALG